MTSGEEGNGVECRSKLCEGKAARTISMHMFRREREVGGMLLGIRVKIDLDCVGSVSRKQETRVEFESLSYVETRTGKI